MGGALTTALGWRVAAASVPGTSHARAGLPCQDAHAWAVLGGGLTAVAVADGAGYARHAHAGSRLAADAALASLSASAAAGGDPGGAVTAALAAARDAVLAAAAGQGLAASELATTLIVALLGEDAVWAGQVGDGAVVVQDAAGALHALTVPAAGEFANETVFLTLPGAVEEMQLRTWEGAAPHAAVFTDGLQALALRFPGAVPHAPFFGPLFRFAAAADDAAAAGEQLAAFLGGPRVTARCDDDLTLVLATRRAP